MAHSGNLPLNEVEPTLPQNNPQTFEQLIATQNRSFDTLKRHCESANRVSGDDLTIAALENRLRFISNIWELCVITESQIQNSKTVSSDPYFTNRRFETTEDYFLKNCDRILRRIADLEKQNLTPASSRTNAAASQSTTQTSQHLLTSLRKIIIPKFSGNVIDWATFRDYFTSLTINNVTLDNLQKFHFLKSALEGEAASLLKNVPLTESNFISAWDRLNERFNNPRALTQAELKLLFSIPAMKDGSASSLKLIRDSVTERIAALENLGRFPNLTGTPKVYDLSHGVSDILVFLISQKFDSDTGLAWELKLDNQEYPHFSKLLNFIDSRIRALEAIQPNDVNKRKFETVRSHVVANGNKGCCPLCKQVHKLYSCIEFKRKTVSQRLEFVKANRICFNCLNNGHSVTTCSSSYFFSQCGSKHHTLLHIGYERESIKPDNKGNIIEVTSASKLDAPKVGQQLHTSSTLVEPHRILLATAKVIVTSESGRSIRERALLDQGSTWTFVTNELVNFLKVRTKRLMEVELLGLGSVSAGESRSMVPIKIQSRTGKGPLFSTNALIMKHLTDYVPTVSSLVLQEPHLQGLNFADDDLQGYGQIHMIIGAVLYGSELLNGLKKGSKNCPVAQNTALGWILSGRIMEPCADARHSANGFVHHCISNDKLHKNLERFWEIEELPHLSNLSQAEQDCEKYFVNSHSRQKDGRYMVRLPFKSEPPLNIGDSLRIAKGSLSALNKKFAHSSELFKKYDDFLVDYEKQGHMTRIKDRPVETSQVVYLPHHPVVRESSTTTNLRVVFNAS